MLRSLYAAPYEREKVSVYGCSRVTDTRETLCCRTQAEKGGGERGEREKGGGARVARRPPPACCKYMPKCHAEARSIANDAGSGALVWRAERIRYAAKHNETKPAAAAFTTPSTSPPRPSATADIYVYAPPASQQRQACLNACGINVPIRRLSRLPPPLSHSACHEPPTPHRDHATPCRPYSAAPQNVAAYAQEEAKWSSKRYVDGGSRGEK